ncbi:MAG: HAMP domain-containing sensor histidine kinase [Motiliproteus sp.]
MPGLSLFSSFYSKLSLALIGSFLLVALALLLLAQKVTQDYQYEVEQKLHHELAAQLVKGQNFVQQGKIDHQGLKRSFHDMMILGPSFEFYLLSPEGRVLTYSAEPERIQRQQVDLAPIEDFLSGQVMLPILGQDPRSTERLKIFSVAEIRDAKHNDSRLQGYLYIIIGGEAYDDVISLLQQSHIVALGFWGLAAGLLFGLIALLLLFFLMTRPLRRLSRDMDRFSAQGFASGGVSLSDWDVHSGNEIHRLGSRFQELAQQLTRQYQQVKDTDTLRRELISYVSHDLRTPLASLKGYLETWQLKRDQLEQDQAARLIEIALNNACQIEALVEQLFELAYLDGDDVSLPLEPVAVAELAQDVIQTLQLQAKALGVTLTLDPQAPALRVLANIEKLERVFTNLLDNAIRHTPAGGEVKINFCAQATQLDIVICDTGIGIDPEDLPRLFEPHFRARNSIKGKAANSGLGLAITRRILQLHGSDIRVSSALGQGSDFGFSLPLA